ncbi:hypothetical protein M0R45_019516 [Rubus argutus]|uniref:Uncharacterized protein n=1 Tax=Rubus argutus TaxID=59490 RepID=A0AAW1X627_RUBAR
MLSDWRSRKQPRESYSADSNGREAGLWSMSARRGEHGFCDGCGGLVNPRWAQIELRAGQWRNNDGGSLKETRAVGGDGPLGGL